VSKTKNKYCRYFVLYALCMLASACARTAPQPSGSPLDTLYVGVATTASASTEGSLYAPYAHGASIAVAHLNATVGAGQRPFGVRLIGSRAMTAVAMATTLRDDPAVIGVVGHSGSAATLEAAPIYSDVENGGRNALVAVSPTATNPLVTKASPWVFRVCPTDRDAALALARYTVIVEGVRRAALIYRNDLFGRGYQRDFRPAFESLGGEIIEAYPYLQGMTDLTAYARRVARSDVDGLVLIGSGIGAGEILRTLRHEGAGPVVLGTDDLSGVAMQPENKDLDTSMRYTSFYLPDRAVSDVARRFRREYRERFGVNPDHKAALTYDAVMLIGRAAIEAGPDRARIREWIAARGNGSLAFEGVTGQIRFDDWGDAEAKDVYIAEAGR